MAKGSPTYLPMGPFLVPAVFIDDPQNLRITLKLNGQMMQDESTADMIFGVARIIEFLSANVQLWPGDLIATGSPAGNGTHYNRYLTPGDLMEGSITDSARNEAGVSLKELRRIVPIERSVQANRKAEAA